MSAMLPGAADAATRMLAMAKLLFEGGTVTTRYVMRTFGVSLATAKRDLAKLEASLPVEVAWRDASPNNPGKHLTYRWMGRDGNTAGPSDRTIFSRSEP